MDYFMDDASQSITPTNHGGISQNNEHHSALAKQAFLKHQAQIKGYQFRFKEKAFLAYLKKYPLYIQKSQLQEQKDQQNTTATLGSTSFQSGRSEVGAKSKAGLAQSKVTPLKATGFGGNRIEEDREEDEDDSSSQKQPPSNNE
jgi:hypothetical protein